MLQNLANEHELILISFLVLFFAMTGIAIFLLCTHQKIQRMQKLCEGITPTLIGVPAIMFSLTAALMATSLWDQYSGAAKAIRVESQGIASYIQLAETVPGFRELELGIRAREYARSVLEDEWEGMGADRNASGAQAKTKDKFQALQIATFRAADK